MTTFAADADIHPDAHVGPFASIGARCKVGAGAVIGPGCIIGIKGQKIHHRIKVAVAHFTREGAILNTGDDNRLNAIGEADAEAIYNDLATLSDNEEWQRKLRGGYSRRLSGENRDSPIALIDFKHPGRNAFHVTSQFRVAAQRPRVPDIVLFVPNMFFP